jgi:hypothetical protein
MPANGDCTPKCPNGDAMPANGQCNPPPCVPGTTSTCGTVTPGCVSSAADNRCGGGGAVLGETLGRPAEVLGVVLTRAPGTAAPAAVAPASLARTGGAPFGTVRLGLLIALAGLLLVAFTRFHRRPQPINISERIGL